MEESRKIKVLYIQAFAGGGSLTALYEMLRNINTGSIEPIVLCYYKNDYTAVLESIPYCKVFYINPGKPQDEVMRNKGKFFNYILQQKKIFSEYFYTDKSFVKRLFSFIKEHNPNIIHHNNDAGVNSHAIRAASKAGVRQVIHNRSLPSYSNNPVGYLLHYFLVRKAHFYINITNAVQNCHNGLFHLSATNSLVLHDFVDTSKFKPLAPDKKLMHEFDIKETDFVITDIGRVIKWKGQHVLLEALNHVKNKQENFKVLIVGPYEKGIGSEDYYAHLQNLAANYELQDKIIFTGNRDDISEIINSSSLVVHSAIKPEPQGLVIIETLLCKKPVIASEGGGSAEIVNKYGGILVKPSDAKALAELLIEVMANGTDALKATDAQYERLLFDFDSAKQMQQILNVYLSVLKN